MKKNLKIGIGVVAAMVIGISAYGMAGGGFQGRFEYNNKNYIAGSAKLCLKPEEWEKKYPLSQSTPPSTEKINAESEGGGTRGGGGSTTTESKKTEEGGSTPEESTEKRGGETEEESKTVVIKNPEVDLGRGVDIINKTEDEKDEKNYIPKTEYVECSCARQGFEYETKDDQGKVVINICKVDDPMKCVDPDFLCPDGTTIDSMALNNLCKAKKQKNCFGAMKPDFTSKEDAMCKSLMKAYKEPICPTPDECKEISEGDKNFLVCNWMYQDGKSG